MRQSTRRFGIFWAIPVMATFFGNGAFAHAVPGERQPPPSAPAPSSKPQDKPAPAPAPAPEAFRPDPSWKALGPNLWFDPKNKHVVILTRVVLRDGALEHLMCSQGTKEHEAILATPASPRMIHAGLLLAGAEPGHTVRFEPKYEPPAGPTIRIELEWKDAATGEKRTANAKTWVRDLKNRDLAVDWVFAGSLVIKDPQNQRELYAAEEGDLITVANFASAILDLPISSSASDAERNFTANPNRVPPLETPVIMRLIPVVAKKPASKP